MKLNVITESASSPLAKRLAQLSPAIATAAQAIYDSWDQEASESGDLELGGGGICDLIANAIGGILADAGINHTEGGHDGDDHAYIIAYDHRKAYSVDIPHQYYESGGGMSWSKEPDVVFTPDMVEIHETYRPDWIEDEYDGLEDADEFANPTKSEVVRNHFPDSIDIPSPSLDPQDIRGLPRLESYEGLEDADEFSDYKPCPICGNTVGLEDFISCESCDAEACESCVRGGEHRDFFGLTPTGWMYSRRGSSYCPRCADPQPSDRLVESYEGLEDADEFHGDCEYCNDCNSLRWSNPSRCPVCGGCFCYDHYSRHKRRVLDDQGKPHWVFCHLTESYEGLEDNDEFQEDEMFMCEGCGELYHADHIRAICECECVWCDNCVDTDESKGIGSRFVWVPDYTDATHEHINSDAGNLVACPCCMGENYVSPYSKEQYAYHNRELNESYEGLEDNDEFVDPEAPIPLIVDKDFVDLFSQWYDGQRDPVYAVLSRAIASPSRHREWTGEGSNNDYPKSILVTPDEAHSIKRLCAVIIHTGRAFANDQDRAVADKYYKKLDDNLANESYEGLEDNDEFEDDFEFCDACGRDIDLENSFYSECDGCGHVWCERCLDRLDFVYVPEFTDGTHKFIHPDAGNIAACPNCMGPDYVSPYSDDQYEDYEPETATQKIDLWPLDESYEGLEDADEFGVCIICGDTLDNGNIECSGCSRPICLACKANWETWRRANTSTHPPILCPSCKYNEIKQRHLNESYEGLEDNDEFKNRNHYCDTCDSSTYWCDICGTEWCDCTGKRPTVGISDNDDIRKCAMCGDWYCKNCGGDYYFDNTVRPGKYNICNPCASRNNAKPVLESYEGLEDNDQFGEDVCVICGSSFDDQNPQADECATCHGEICKECMSMRNMKYIRNPSHDMFYGTRCSGCRRPICRSCEADWVVDGTPNRHAHSPILCNDCRQRQYERDIEQAHEDAFLRESAYEGLEDADEFRNPESCEYCGVDNDPQNGVFVAMCVKCYARACDNCIDKNGWKYDRKLQGRGGYGLCPECLKSPFVSTIQM